MLERVEKREHSCTLGGYDTATMENSMEVPKTLKIELPYDPAIPLLGIYPEKTIIQKSHVPQCSLQHYLQ